MLKVVVWTLLVASTLWMGIAAQDLVCPSVTPYKGVLFHRNRGHFSLDVDGMQNFPFKVLKSSVKKWIQTKKELVFTIQAKNGQQFLPLEVGISLNSAKRVIFKYNDVTNDDTQPVGNKLKAYKSSCDELVSSVEIHVIPRRKPFRARRLYMVACFADALNIPGISDTTECPADSPFKKHLFLNNHGYFSLKMKYRPIFPFKVLKDGKTVWIKKKRSVITIKARKGRNFQVHALGISVKGTQSLIFKYRQTNGNLHDDTYDLPSSWLTLWADLTSNPPAGIVNQVEIILNGGTKPYGVRNLYMIACFVEDPSP